MAYSDSEKKKYSVDTKARFLELFEVDEEKQTLEVVNDEKIIDEVLELYQALIEDGDKDGKK